MSTTSLRAAPFVIAIVVAAALVLSAPFVGQIRSAMKQAFPGQFLAIVGAVIGLGVMAALGVAAWRIRDRRLARYGAITLALLIAAGYSALNATEFPESNAVERFHFLQYGLITFLFYRAWRPLGDGAVLVLPVLAGLIVGTTEEWLQWFIPARVGDIRDVALNLVAILSGLLFSLGLDPPRRITAAIAPVSRPRVVRMTTAAVLTLAVFFHVLHLGHEIVDREIGRFASRYSAEDLLALQAERTRSWRATPPPTRLVRLSREDQYLSEGIEHVRERNERWTAGDVRAAWLENRIMEKYYAPVLHTATHHGPGHGWPAEQRADAQGRAGNPGDGAAAAPFVSQAYPYRIYAWPKALFWFGVLLLAGGISATGFRQRST